MGAADVGGIGSGRHGGAPVVEDALALDLARLARLGLLIPGIRSGGTLQWKRAGGAAAAVAFVADLRDLDAASVRLLYSVRGAPRDQLVQLTTTRPGFGEGVRWWWRCPRTGGRARVLYLPPDGACFASRAAHGLGYASARASPVDRAIERALAAQRRLGITSGDVLTVPRRVPRPAGMRRARYRALLAELEATADLLCARLGERQKSESC